MHQFTGSISMLKDQKDLLAAFNAHGIEYLVVGGHAAIAYGVARLTRDLDIWIRGDQATSGAVFAALATYGAPVQSMSPADFCESSTTIIQFGLPPNRIDILQGIEGVTFDDAWERRVDAVLDDGNVVHYLSADDLIRNKEMVGRPGDVADVDELRKMRNLK